MERNNAKRYILPLGLSLALVVVIAALRVEKEPLNLFLIFLGSLIGTFFLDLDYILTAYFLDPESDFSKTLKGYFKHSDIFTGMAFVYSHEDAVEDKTLNSVIFQGVLAMATLLVVTSPESLFMKAFVLSTFLNSIYRLVEHYYTNKLQDWFWALKTPPTKKGFIIYTSVLVATLLFSLYFI